MLPPRHPKPHGLKLHPWRCDTCGRHLGTVKPHPRGGPVLFPGDGFAGALRTTETPGTFRLLCTAGHWTDWQGSGIKWFPNSEQEQAA